MKNLTLFIVLFLTTVIGVSCQDQMSGLSKEEKFKEIAYSDLYAKYKTNFYNHALIVATKMFNDTAVNALIDQYPEKLHFKNFDRKLFENIRGGLLYYDSQIESDKLYDQLKEKYQYDTFSDEERAKIRAIYKQKTGGAQQAALNEKIKQYYINKAKKQ